MVKTKAAICKIAKYKHNLYRIMGLDP